jgi:hypothetical protein
MTRRTLTHALVAAIALFATVEARAESVFGLNLLGERLEGGDVRAVALGGSHQLLDDSLAVLQHNPAMLSHFKRVTFGASQLFSSDLNRSDIGPDEEDVGAKFTAFGLAFPVFGRVTLAMTYHGRYDPDGEFTLRKVSDAGDGYREEFIRQGGLNSYRFAAATNVTRFVKVGAFFSIENGSIENRWNTIFDSRSQARAFNIQDRTLSGNGWGAGVVVRPLRQVMLGVTYEGEVTYDTSVRLRYTNSSAEGLFDEETVLPATWTAAGHWKNSRYAVYASATLTDFEQFEGLDFPSNRLYRSEAAAVGFEYLSGVPLFGRRFPLRLSLSWERLPYDFPEGERITRIVGGVGAGLNFRDGKGKIDFALQTGKIGSKDANGLETRLLRFYVGVSGSEAWKRKRQSAY